MKDLRRLHQCDSERAQREGERDEVKIHFFHVLFLCVVSKIFQPGDLPFYPMVGGL